MQRYSRIAIFLHWAIAALLAFQLAVGWALEDLGARGFGLFQWHKTIGISVLLLTLARVVVRFWKPRPAPVEGGWQGALAKAVHVGLYAFMLGAPLSGWALVSTAKVKVPTLLFGVIPLPHLPLPMAMSGPAHNAHALLALLGVGLFALHVAGALRHHFLQGDGLIWRMMPARSALGLVGLPATIAAAFLLGRAILPAAAPDASSAETAIAANAVAEEDAVDDATLESGNLAEAPANGAAAVADNGSEAAAAETPAGPPPAWTVRPGGKISFSVDNGGEAIRGGFAKWTAKIVMDPERPESADIRVEIDPASASVGDSYQDGMLVGEEFFAVATHPRAVFTAKGAERTGANGYRASGTLTLKGVSKPQTIRFTLSGSGKTRKVSGSATIARAAFGVGMGESGAGLAPSVSVQFNFDAVTE